jgi:hypothetical protein
MPVSIRHMVGSEWYNWMVLAAASIEWHYWPDLTWPDLTGCDRQWRAGSLATRCGEAAMFDPAWAGRWGAGRDGAGRETRVGRAGGAGAEAEAKQEEGVMEREKMEAGEEDRTGGKGSAPTRPVVFTTGLRPVDRSPARPSSHTLPVQLRPPHQPSPPP